MLGISQHARTRIYPFSLELERNLVLNKRPGNSAPSPLGARSTERADEGSVRRSLSLDIIGLHVHMCAREVRASGNWGVGGSREDLLYAVDIIGVDNGRDIVVDLASEAIETDLSKHTRNIGSAFRDRVPVADPASGEGLVGGTVAGDGDGGERLETLLRCDDDGAGCRVLVDEVHAVGCGDGGESRKEEAAEELHLE